MTATVLPLQPLTAGAFAPYGEVFEWGRGAARAINAGTSARRDLPSVLDLERAGGRGMLALFEASAQAAEGPWQLLERHRLGSQTFVPLDAVAWVVLVAQGEAAPDRATLAAFEAAPGQGITLRAGTWHHPLIALAPGRFLVVERTAAGPVDCDVLPLAPPVRLQR